MALEQDDRISEVVTRERSRLRGFIRRRVSDAEDAEDVLQDVFARLVEANRLLIPIDHLTGWLYRTARNRIVDLFRRKRLDPLGELDLPSSDADPERLYERDVVLEEIVRAIQELPESQREVFVAHELDGRSFREIAAETGVGVNTLLSRKRYAVLRLQERLRSTYDDLMKR